MNALIWHLPAWIHRLILELTGYRLVKVRGDQGQTLRYFWTNVWPL